MNFINSNTLNRTTSLVLILALTVPLVLTIPRTAAAVEQDVFGGTFVPDPLGEGGFIFQEAPPVTGGGPTADPLGETGGAPPAQGVLGAAGCVGTLASYIPGVNTFSSLFTGQAPTKDLGTTLSTLVTCGQTFLNLIQSTFTSASSAVTAGGVTALTKKIVIVDPVATALLKRAINITRDMIVRWILTGRFEGPVFSKSFTIDAQNAAETAARLFLSDLTKIDFCKSFGPPSIPQLTLSANLGLNCSLDDPFSADASFDLASAYVNPNGLDEVQNYLLSLPQNNALEVYARLSHAKAEAEARAVSSFREEYAAGQGFLGIRNKDGTIQSPGIYVAELVMQSQIVSPIRQTDVADTVQAAIAQIIDTAIRATLEKGLGGALGRSR